MYDPRLVAAAQARLEGAFLSAFPKGLTRYPVEVCAGMAQRLATAVDASGQPTRRLTPEEDAFIGNERLLTKIDYRYCAERYHYCNPPEAPIWMGDMSFRPLGDIKPGDVIIGWETQKTRAYKKQHVKEVLTRTRVLAVQRRVAPIVRVTMASGRVLRCTLDHLWSQGKLAQRYGRWKDKHGKVHRYYHPWTTAAPGRWLSHVIDPVYPDRAQVRTAAWLGGVYDGEGSYATISQHEAHNPAVFQRIGEACGQLGVAATPLKNRQGYSLSGGRQGYVNFLVQAQPVRAEQLVTKVLTTHFREADQIIAVEPDGEGEVIGLTTQTGNYVVWGYASKNCNSEGQGLKRLFPLWESQTLVLDRMAQIQRDRTTAGHPDGLLVNILKARQLGVSTLGASLVTHRATTHTHVRALLASDVPDNSGSEGLFGMYERLIAHLPWYLKPREQFHAKNQHVIFENGSALLVESGKSMKGGLTEEGGAKGNLGRSKTFSVVHLTELSTWERPEQIDDGLMPAVPRSPRTLGIEESTAKGRHNWHHEDWLAAVRGRSRFSPVFIPWYAEQTKYWLPAPIDWAPLESTVAHAKKATAEGPKWLGRPVRLTRQQLYWYEQTRALYQEKGKLAKFLEEYAADPEECFQHSGRSIFSIDDLQYLDKLAKPPIDVWMVNPAKDLSTLRASELAQIRLAKQLAATAVDTPAPPIEAMPSAHAEPTPVEYHRG